MRTVTIQFLFFSLFLSATGFSDFFEYNPNGQPITIVNAIGRRTSLEYDQVGRLAKITYPDEKTVAYRYDENDNRIEMEDVHGITRFAYDDRDRLISISYPGLHPLIYTYNDVGQVISMKYPTGEDVFYRYDDSGRLVTVDHQNGIVKYIYEHSSNLPSKIIYPNGVCTEYTYDAVKQVTAVIHRNVAGPLILSYRYQYDPNGNCIFSEENSELGKRSAKYSYDKLDRFIEASYSDGTFEKYTYDGFSNRIVKETEKGTETYLYDSGNRLVQKGDVHFYYNNLGNLVKKEHCDEIVEYFYDDNNYLIEVKTPRHHVTFVYDGDGKRIYKTLDGVKTRYINDVGAIPQVLVELDGNMQLHAEFFYADRRLFQLNRDRQAMFYLYDHPIRNVAALIDEGGRSFFYSYDAFGVVSGSPRGIANFFQYAGEQLDEEIGLIYLRNRYYDPEIGRFITPDPHRGSLLNPHSWNPYIYVLNNPLKYIDPLGLDKLKLVAYPPGAITEFGKSLAGHTFLIRVLEDGREIRMGKYATFNPFKKMIKDSDKICPGSITYTWDISTEVGETIEREFGQKGFYLLFKNNCTDAAIEMIQKYVDPEFSSKKMLGIHNPTDCMQAISEKKGERCNYLDQLNKEKNAIWENYESDALAPTSNGLRYYLKHFLGASDRGGISLYKTANLMINLAEIIGSVFDEKTGQLILVGRRNYYLPHLDPDDFAVAIRSVYGLGSKPVQDPGISMDPYPIGGFPEAMRVRYEGETENTAFGNILFEADKLLKDLSLGKDNATGKKIKSHVKGYTSLPTRYDKENFSLQGDVYTRLWFVPEDIRVTCSSDKNIMQFEQVKMQVLSEATYHNKPSYNFPAENFARHMTDHYQEYAEEFPILQELERLGQITGVVKWIKDNHVPLDLSLFKEYQPRFVPTPKTVPVTAVPFGGFRCFIFGGVSYALGSHNYAQRTTEALGSMKDMALQSRPSDTNFMWEFYDGNTPYLAVAETLFRTPKTGNVKKTFLDMNFSAAGQYPLSLARTYNSYDEEESGFGKGWSIAPAHLKFPMPKMFLSNADGQVEGYLTILVKDEEGENVYVAKKYYPEGDMLYLSEKSSGQLREQADGTFVLAKGDASFWTFDHEGRLLNIQDRSGVQIYYHYDKSHLIRIQHQNGSAIEFIYRDGRIVEAIGLGGKTVYYTYGTNKQLESVSDQMGLLCTFSYDEEKRLTKICNSTGTAVFSAAYDIYARAVALTDGPLSYTQIFDISSGFYQNENHAQIIDSLCRIHQIKDSLHRTMQISYEGDSFFPSQIQDPIGNSTHYEYDTKGRLRAIQRADGSVKKFWYDSKGRLTLSQNGKGVYTAICYDDQDRVILQARSCHIEFTQEGAKYDAKGAQVTTYTYQENNLKPSSIRLVHQKPEQFTYHSNGQLAKVVFANGEEMRFVYDTRHRLSKVYENDMPIHDYTYNERDLVTSITTPYGKTTYERDVQGNIIILIDPNNHKTFFDYDAYNRLIQITDAEGGVTTYSYDASSRLQEISFPEGSKRNFIYDVMHHLTKDSSN